MNGDMALVPPRAGTTSESAPLPMPEPTGPPEPTERLEARICELAGHLTATTCQFLLLVADFDERRGWASWELPSCAAWLSWKCQIAPGTAREQVRVARSLAQCPLIHREFAAGRLSYAKVRALTRIVTPDTEADLVAMAIPMTAGQLERFAQAHRRVSEAGRGQPRPARRLTWGPAGDLDRQFRVVLPAEDAAVILQALRAARNDLEHPHDDHDHDDYGDGENRHGDGGHGQADEDGGVSAETRHHPRRRPGHHRRGAGRRFRGSARPAAADGTTCPAWTAGCPAGAAVLASRAPRPLPPRRRPGHQPGRPGADRLQRHHLHHDPRPVRRDHRRRPPHPQAPARPAPRPPRTRRRPLPVSRLRLPPHRRPPHPLLGQRRPDQPGQPHQRLQRTPRPHPRQGHHHRHHPAGFAFYTKDGAAIPRCPRLAPPAADITTTHNAAITPTTINPPHGGERLNLSLAIWTAFANARTQAARRQGDGQIS